MEITKINNQQTMSSLEIAELTGKQHKDVLKAIRNMETAWEKVQGLKFQLSSRTYQLPNGGKKIVPCYELTKTECLYVATKFNDEARAKLVLRWEELERTAPMTPEGVSLTGRAEFTEKVQLMLPSKEEIVQSANQIVGEELRRENKVAEKCLTATEVAKQWGMKVKRFNRLLVDAGIQKYQNRGYCINEKYEGMGLTEYRLFKGYTLDGKPKNVYYMVWTPLGVKWLESLKEKILMNCHV